MKAVRRSIAGYKGAAARARESADQAEEHEAQSAADEKVKAAVEGGAKAKEQDAGVLGNLSSWLR